MWAGIKKALNSTLGTSEFKPLDQLIAEERNLVASDNLYRYLYAGEITKYADTTELTAFSFQSNRKGSIRLKFNAKCQSSAGQKSIRIYRNNYKVSNDITIPTAFTETDTSIDISVGKGDVITIKAYYSVANASLPITIRNARICANELNISGITIL